MRRPPRTIEATKRTTARREERRSERGDTLVEVLLAIIVLGLASVALLIAFGTSITASAAHRQLAASSIALDSISQEVTSDMQATPSLFTTCPYSATAYQNATFLSGSFTVPTGFTATFASSNPVEYWSTTSDSFTTTCANGQSQQISITITNTTNHQTFTNSFVVDPTLDTVTGSGSGASATYGAAAKLAFTTQPVGGSTGQLLATQPVITVEDASGNTVLDDLSPILLSLSVPSGYTMPNGAALTGCSGSERSGVVTFTGCSINDAGTYTITALDSNLSGTYVSSSFTVSASTDYLVFSTQPAAAASGSLLSTQPVVKAYTSSGFDSHWTGTITLSASGGSLTNCSAATVTAGVATFTSCKFAGGYYYNSTSGVYLATPYTLTATASNSVATSPVTSSAFGVTGPGPASQLVFSTQPTGSASITSDPTPAFSTQPVVTIEDAFGNVVTSSTASVTLSISSGTLNSCSANPVAASGGSATFSGCQGSALGNNLKLTASSSGLTSATSASFNITGAATQLIFTTQPKAGVSGAAFETQPVVTIEDSSGNTVTAASTTLSFTVTPSSGTLALCTNLTPYFGVVDAATCTFSGTVGTSYYLTATEGSLTQNSGLFTPTAAGTPTQLAFAVQPVAGAAGSALTTQPVIDIEDSAGNITTSSATISLTSSSGTLSSCSNLTALEGVVQVTNCTLGGLDTASYTLTATSGSFSAATSSSFTLTGPGPASSTQSTIAAASGTVLDNGTASTTVTVTLEDAYTNVISGKSIFLSQSGTSSVITPNPATTNSSGVATFTVTDTNREIATYSAADTTDATAISGSAQVSFVTQLTAPTGVTLSYGSTAGSLGVTFTAPTNAATGQTYTALACTNSGMTTGCVGPAAITSGGQITGLSATQGSVGSTYYVTITASASTGYLASTSSVAGPQNAMSQVNGPTNVTVTSSASTAGAVVVTFTNATGTAPTSYTAQACTGSGTGCGTGQTVTSGSSITGLTAGTSYYVMLTANGPTGYLSTSVNAGPGMATIQITQPTNVALAYGTTSGSLTVTFTAPTNPATGQTYTALACQNSGMTTSCVGPAAITSGGQITGLSATQGSAGVNYYVTVTATASTGYLSSTSAVAGPQADTSQVNAPTGFSTAPSTTTAGALTATFTASTGVAPASYTAKACTVSNMTGTCFTQTSYTSGSQFTGLTQGTNYYVQITAVGPSGYASATSSISAATLATTQLNPPSPVLVAGSGTSYASLQITGSGTNNGPGSQAYTYQVCTGSGTGCLAAQNVTGYPQVISTTNGSTALTAGTTYYVQVTATASTGYLASTAQAGSAVATLQLGTPTAISATTNGTNALNVTWTNASNDPAGSNSFTITACTNNSFSTGCVTTTFNTSGNTDTFTGLATSTNYYLEVKENASIGYLASAYGTNTSTTYES